MDESAADPLLLDTFTIWIADLRFDMLLRPLGGSVGLGGGAGSLSRSFSQKRRARLSSSSTPKAMMMRTTMAMGWASIWVSNEGLSFMRIAIVIIKSSPIMSTKTRA